jgi:hypothetical protein
MKPPPYDESRLVPLASDAIIHERVTELIGRANQRQLWLLFLDEFDVQLPLLIPIDGLPPSPDGYTPTVIANVRELMDDIGAASLIVVWERYGPAALSAGDTAWARALAAACVAEHLGLRAMLLSHRGGVRWLAPDDYL